MPPGSWFPGVRLIITDPATPTVSARPEAGVPSGYIQINPTALDRRLLVTLDPLDDLPLGHGQHQAPAVAGVFYLPRGDVDLMLFLGLVEELGEGQQQPIKNGVWLRSQLVGHCPAIVRNILTPPARR